MNNEEALKGRKRNEGHEAYCGTADGCKSGYNQIVLGMAGVDEFIYSEPFKAKDGEYTLTLHKQAEWEEIDHDVMGMSENKCTGCGFIYKDFVKYHYCPNCGAKMEDKPCG